MTELGKKEKVPERLLARIWREQLIRRESLLTSGGKRIEIVYPGRENDDYGPDFRDAILWVEERLLQGDVELHVRTGQWQAHGHHRDPGYNRVILHVVMWDGKEGGSYLESGEKVPVLGLYPYLIPPLEELSPWLGSPEPCPKALEHLSPEAIAELLDRAGEERFLFKADQFKAELATKEAGQVLWEGIMRALGYSRNKKPFQELAQILPLSTLKSLAQARTRQGYIFRLQALLLGMAGLLPGQRWRGRGEEDEETRGLEGEWHSFGIRKTMAEAEWRFSKVRPENFPPRRLVGASYLLARYKEEGILEGMLRLVSKGQAGKEIEEGIRVKVSGYWASHLDFGVEAGGRPNLIGRGRAREIVINILLPFFFAWGEIEAQPQLKESILELYHSYPRHEENWVTRYVAKHIFNQPVVNSAQRQQGAIHLYKTFCAERRCADCPLARGRG